MPQPLESEVWCVTSPPGTAKLATPLHDRTANGAVKASRRVGPQFETVVLAKENGVLG